MSQIVPRII
jgi:hypothetical protein